MDLFGFGKKKNTEPGLQVRIEAPESVGMHDQSFTVALELRADSHQMVTLVRVRLIGEYLGQEATGAAGAMQLQKTFAEIIDRVEFSLSPGEAKRVQFTMPMDPAAFQESMPEQQQPGGAPQTVERLQSFANTVHANSYQYFILADVTVQGSPNPASVRVPTLVTRPQGKPQGGNE